MGLFVPYFQFFATFVKKTILRNSYSLVMLKCKCSYYYILLILIQNCSNTLISKGCEICKTNHSREKKIHGWLCWWSILYDTTIKTQFFLANFRTIKVIICIKLFCLPLISIYYILSRYLCLVLVIPYLPFQPSLLLSCQAIIIKLKKHIVLV